MPTSRPANFIRKVERTYIVVAIISDELRAQIASIQADIEAISPGTIWPMPREALHITLFEIMQRGNFPFDKDDYFNEHRLEIFSGLDGIMRSVNKIELNFTKLVISQDAITLQSDDVDEFNEIRQAISDKIPIPPETKMPPPVVHISFARFQKSVDTEPVERLLLGKKINIKLTVDCFELRKTKLQPMLDFDILRSYALYS